MAIFTDLTPKLGAPKSNEQTAFDRLDGAYNYLDKIKYQLIDYKIDEDAQAIRNSLLNIFLVQQGEVAGKPDFGNPINIMTFDLFNQFEVQTLESTIRNVVSKYEPRVNILRLEIIKAEEFNRLIVQIDYEFNLNNTINYDSIEMPYAHNTVTFLGGRLEPQFPELIGDCQPHHLKII